MSTNKKIKTDNKNKIFQDIIDFEILKSIINYLLISNKNKNNNKNSNTCNQYKINKFYFNRNEILNYILVSKKWYNFISLTISNNIINNKLFEHWLINNNINNSFIENYNNQNQYDKNNLIFDSDKKNKINFNKEFSIIKIKESIINDYFKFNLFLHKITIDDFKEIKNKFENNQLLYNRIVVNICIIEFTPYNSELYEYVSNENSETISNLFKILELNCDNSLEYGYIPVSEEGDKLNNKYNGLYLNNLSIDGFDTYVDEDEDTLKIFNILKGKNIIYGVYDTKSNESPTHINYSALFDPDNSGQQVESIKVQCCTDYEEAVEARHLIKVNQFENLHSITIPINSFQILSNLSEEMEFHTLYRNRAELGNSGNMKSELNQMINSFITSKSLKNLNIKSENSIEHFHPNHYYDGNSDHEIFVNKINETIESYSNSFKPLFSELNTSIERIEFDCMGLLNIDTFSNLLNNKSIKYLSLYGNSDFIVYSSKPTGDNGGSKLHEETISINQYLFENIFTSPLTPIRHYKINIKNSKQIKSIFNLILNNIFKLQLYSLIFEFNENELICEFVKEFKNLINNISIQLQQEQQEHQKSKNINLKEIKIKINNDNEYSQELNI
ncbi:hypothetical protein DDB_G0269084 [Dictyostelium discoideum AX4]|uniref:Uncharacterized protein n=1 Tax=Dictyostelium discoideum TaxID=44689 RepID=Q55ER1_DICDI|nr:hypothetical protein DDB_G0269084 [Dictyostelium discoideum AX4]EAL73131.1 hypothetical protein DDB_G0269084 [Dictyostelium discoideum AX4]|eukprot:XP_646959.1 hypothetical protein DDB_G0269084 [Dictyostelium discoideum AX4]